ncbi:MAG: phosphate butyryltransferase [Bacteroidales bacterium]|jgi:phosphate butyryltransferase|nr:phosphate acyltransferase [Bacteroidales bacterium]MCK9498471.1 phosphate acyltransferase [Bacteroidales bacterium]MDY0315555.1 phosphate acyltransferase [Bacteroidales bacterium]NLB87601.1 phosphate butyryltransferase [Bacteroidales bacterium]
MNITRMDDIVKAVKLKPKKRLSVAFANDSHTIEAVSNAVDLGIVEGILVGDEKCIKDICKKENIDVNKFKIVQEADEMKAANLAVKLINDGEADFLMKGLVSTDKYMRAILNKETGLLPPKATLSHIVVMELAKYPKLLIVSDAAVIPYPDLNQKIQITNYTINVAHALGIEQPKVALITATEQMSPNMPSCVDAAIISKMAERGQIKGALVDGPLALDVAIDKECVAIKKLNSLVGGEADCLVFPNIEAANVFYKTSVKFAGAKLGAILVGAKCSAVLSSRGDSAETKTYSIALAALTSK